MAKVLINDPIVNELAFDALFHLSQPDKIGKLSVKELRAIKNANTARHYASQLSLDEKAILFAKIGMCFSLGVHAVDWNLKDWYKKIKDLTKSKQLAETSKIKVVVVTNKKIINFLNMMSNITHSDGYLLNMDFHRVGKFVNNWKDERRDADSLAEALDYAKVLNRYSLVQTMSMKGVRGKTETGDLDLSLLMFLYDFGDNYVDRPAIQDYFGGAYKKTIIAAALKRLIDKALIERNPTVRLPEYQITSFGTTAVMEFHSKNLQAV